MREGGPPGARRKSGPEGEGGADGRRGGHRQAMPGGSPGLRPQPVTASDGNYGDVGVSGPGRPTASKASRAVSAEGLEPEGLREASGSQGVDKGLEDPWLTIPERPAKPPQPYPPQRLVERLEREAQRTRAHYKHRKPSKTASAGQK